MIVRPGINYMGMGVSVLDSDIVLVWTKGLIHLCLVPCVVIYIRAKRV